MIRTVLSALGISVTVACVGLCGAWAFNPDDGTVAHSELLWRIFGIPAEVAWIATAALALVLVATFVARSATRGLRRTSH